jgi:hypothetical protein
MVDLSCLVTAIMELSMYAFGKCNIICIVQLNQYMLLENAILFALCN